MPKPITTRLHGVLDYLTGGLLLVAPRLLGLGGTGAGRLLRLAGASHAGYSVLTDYELGAVKLVPMRTHLALDAAGALGLAGSPWLFGTARRGARHWLPHVLVGAYEMTAVALSQQAPVEDRGAGASNADQTARRAMQQELAREGEVLADTEGAGVAGSPVVGEVMVRGGTEQGAPDRGTVTGPGLAGGAGEPSRQGT